MDEQVRMGGTGAIAAMVTAAMLVVAAVVVGPAAEPAFGCDCSTPSDAVAFERADAVFVGEVLTHAVPPEVMSSADPATWTFAVSEVYKGEVAATQEVVSEVSGVSCGLEIPEQGEFVVFADFDGFLIDVGEGQYHAGLCSGTRSTAAGPPAVGVTPYEPIEEDAARSPDTTGSGDDEGTQVPLLLLALAAGGFAVIVVIGGVLTLRRSSP